MRSTCAAARGGPQAGEVLGFRGCSSPRIRALNWGAHVVAYRTGVCPGAGLPAGRRASPVKCPGAAASCRRHTTRDTSFSRWRAFDHLMPRGESGRQHRVLPLHRRVAAAGTRPEAAGPRGRRHDRRQTRSRPPEPKATCHFAGSAGRLTLVHAYRQLRKSGDHKVLNS